MAGRKYREFGARPNRTVILSQRARWRENPLDLQSAICRALLGCSVDFGDSHTSDTVTGSE